MVGERRKDGGKTVGPPRKERVILVSFVEVPLESEIALGAEGAKTQNLE